MIFQLRDLEHYLEINIWNFHYFWISYLQTSFTYTFLSITFSLKLLFFQLNAGLSFMLDILGILNKTQPELLIYVCENMIHIFMFQK